LREIEKYRVIIEKRCWNDTVESLEEERESESRNIYTMLLSLTYNLRRPRHFSDVVTETQKNSHLKKDCGQE